MRLSLIAILVISLYSCDSSQPIDFKITTEDETIDYTRLGDSLANIAQQTLLSNVAREMQIGGPSNALEFCNHNVSHLMDSLTKEHDVTFFRISSKFRNPLNEPSSDELALLKIMESEKLKDTIIESGSELHYYKTINVGLEACLKCHGPKETIDDKTLALLGDLYPEDKATNYKLGDFRGAWKIVMND